MATIPPITLKIALEAKRVEAGEIEAVPRLWRAVFGTEPDLDLPAETIVGALVHELNRRTGVTVADDDLDEVEAEAPVTLTDEQMEAVDELRHVRSELSDLRKRETDLRKDILQALGNSERGLTGSGAPAVKLRKSVRVGVDRSALEAQYPDVFDEVRTEKEVVIIDLP